MNHRLRVVATVCVSFLVAACASGGDGSSGPAPVAGGFGGRLSEGATFSVVLFVLEDQGQAVDFVGVACAPQGTLLGIPATVGEGVAIEEGGFHAENDDVAIDGRFTSPTRAEGSARPLTPEAEACGVAPESSWSSECDMSAERVEADPGELNLTGTAGTTDRGTAFSVVSVVSEGGARYQGELLESGACSGASP